MAVAYTVKAKKEEEGIRVDRGTLRGSSFPFAMFFDRPN